MTSINGFTPTYDNNGNVLNDNSHTYSWDSEGRPATIDSVNSTYDALGRMVEQNRSGAYTQFVYAPTGQKMQIMNGQGVSCPFGSQFCQFSAGFAQTLSLNPNFQGTLLTDFDTPPDNASIREGQAMKAAGCHE
jgi:hypothetical protein